MSSFTVTMPLLGPTAGEQHGRIFKSSAVLAIFESQVNLIQSGKIITNMLKLVCYFSWFVRREQHPGQTLGKLAFAGRGNRHEWARLWTAARVILS